MYFVQGFWKIRNQLLNFIGDDINYNQHGFVSGKSSLSNILESIDIINEYFIESNNADIIYLDFNKEFGMVPHYCFLGKMKNLSISLKKKNIL